MEPDKLNNLLILNKIPDKETRILKGFDTVINRIEKNNDEKLLNHFAKEFEVSKADQIDLLNKSLKFFKEKDTFDMEDFANEVIEQPEVIESFHNFKRNYESENDIVIDDSFSISSNAFKKQQRSYKRIINLDKKIQIIITGRQILQGVL